MLFFQVIDALDMIRDCATLQRLLWDARADDRFEDIGPVLVGTWPKFSDSHELDSNIANF